VNDATRKHAIAISEHRKVVAHEAGHAAAAIAQGLEVEEVHAPYQSFEDREDMGPNASVGHARIVGDNNERDYWSLAVATLIGPMEEHTPGWPPQRLSFAPTDPDAADLLRACETLGIQHDHGAYRQLVHDAHQLHASHKYSVLHSLITKGLEDNSGHLDTLDLTDIKEAANMIDTDCERDELGVWSDSVVDEAIAQVKADHDAIMVDAARAPHFYSLKAAVVEAPIRLATFDC
jgi:hypothetical protein